MKQPLFPSTIGTQSRFAYFLTVKAVVRKLGKSDGQTGSWCLDKEVLARGGGGYKRVSAWPLRGIVGGMCTSCICRAPNVHLLYKCIGIAWLRETSNGIVWMNWSDLVNGLCSQRLNGNSPTHPPKEMQS